MRTLLGLLTFPLLAGCVTTATQDVTPELDEAPRNIEEVVKLYQADSGFSMTYDSATADLLASLVIRSVGPEGTPVLLISREPDQASKQTAAADMSFQTVAMEFASAADVAEIMRALQSGASAAGVTREASFGADERTNSLLICAPKMDIASYLDSISRLDIEL